ncbi:conserved hypothetical protein [groundwater metagenome]|uniref:GyrI-like small molecule binding domain-containing protein n=1 Tax=groundwater metagenome TaxID=717931 RepID=A0A098EC30_9ZZZZ
MSEIFKMEKMEKTDFKKELKYLYAPPAKEIEIVNVPQMNFLMIDGIGNPDTSQEFKEAIETLYAVSYTIKFIVKKEKSINYVVMPLEGLWWADDMASFSSEGMDKNSWKWTLMIMQPECVTKNIFSKAIEEVKKKKNLPFLSKIRLENLQEGLSAQILYIGPYDAEHTTIEKIHAFIKERGYKFSGKHHEIYLSDPRKTAPEKLKTIIRQPVK